MSEEIKIEQTEQPEKDIVKEMNEILDLTEIAELIRNNEKIFEVNGITYRIKKPTYKQKQEVYKKKIEKYTELLKDERYLLEKDLRELFKKRGVDIDKMDIELKNKMKKRDDLMIRLGGALKLGQPENELKILELEIKDLNNEIQDKSIERAKLLEISLEQQLSVFVYTYFVFVLAEKKDNDNWVKVWNTFDEYEEGDQELINRFSYYCTMMLGSYD